MNEMAEQMCSHSIKEDAYEMGHEHANVTQDREAHPLMSMDTHKMSLFFLNQMYDIVQHGSHGRMHESMWVNMSHDKKSGRLTCINTCNYFVHDDIKDVVTIT